MNLVKSRAERLLLLQGSSECTFWVSVLLIKLLLDQAWPRLQIPPCMCPDKTSPALRCTGHAPFAVLC